MRYLSVCSGIEAATVAWHSLGWKPEAFSEIEKFPSNVLAHHYPTVPNLGDMTKFKEWNIGTIDLLVGGTPCQSFSVAGLRKGLDDPRGNLMLTYLAIAKQFSPKWLVWENVPGVLSSNGGKDFGSLLAGLAELGYGFAYRVLDAQYFGVPQRRKRVFVVGCLGSWQSAAAVLFERHSLQGHSAPQRETGESVAKCLTRGTGQRYDSETDDFITYGIQANIIGRQDYNGGNGIGVKKEIAPTLTKADQHGVAICLNPDRPQVWRVYDVSGVSPTTQAGESRGNVILIPFGVAGNSDTGHCLRSGASKADKTDSTSYIVHGTQDPCTSDIAFALGRNNGQENCLIKNYTQVRRLTPIECERLQGFPDNYTNIIVNVKPCADGPRYKALGNSMAVPVMAWIGSRIQMVEDILSVEVAA